MCSLDGQQGYSSRVEVPALYDRPFSHQVRALDDSPVGAHWVICDKPHDGSALSDVLLSGDGCGSMQ